MTKTNSSRENENNAARDSVSYAGVAVIVALLALLAAAIVWIWLPTTVESSLPIEKYFPLTNGASYVYRITYPDGAVTYRARNVVRAPTLSFLPAMSSDVFAALQKFAGADFDPNADQSVIDAARRKLELTPAAQMIEVEVDASENITRHVSLLARQADAISIIGFDDAGFAPPLPFLSQASREVAGVVNGAIPFTTTLLAAPEMFQSDMGAFQDCVRVTQTLEIVGAVTAQTLYCREVGEVENIQSKANAMKPMRSELIAASVNQFTRGAAPLLPKSNWQGDVVNVWEKAFPLTIGERWKHNELFSNSITTEIVPVGDVIVFGTQNGALVALDPKTRAERWRLQTGGAIYGAPVAANGIVYFGSGDKKLYAVNALTGGLLWAFPTQDVITGSPAVSEDTVYFGSEDRVVYALDALTGAPRWTFETGGAVAATPVVANGVVYVGADDGALYALDTTTGALRWKFRTGKPITGRAVLQDDVIFVASYDGKVYALRAKAENSAARELWSYDAQAPVRHTPIAANGRVYAVTANTVEALDVNTGTRVWKYDSQTELAGAVVVMGNQVWVTRLHDVVVLDAANGAGLSHTPYTDSAVYGELTRGENELYLGYADGTLQALGAQP